MDFKAKKYVLEKEYPISRETVWRLLSDTDSLNRFIGLFPVTFTPAKNKTFHVFYREANAKVAGAIPLKWEEMPFQWVENDYYSVERRYLSGPLKHFVGGIELTDTSEGGTKVRLLGEFTPRNILGIGAIPVTGLQSMRNTLKYMDEFVRNPEKNYSPQKNKNHNIAEAELNRLEEKLKAMIAEVELIELLHQHITTRPDQEVINMRAKSIANRWNRASDEALRLFLFATKAGILSLSWNLICPNCRVSKDEYTSLSNVSNNFHCDLCGVDYNANFENYVELKFSVHPSIRKAYDQSYCVGGPMITPHIIVQHVIKAGETVQLPLSPAQEKLQIRVLQANHKQDITINSDGSTNGLTYTNDGFTISHQTSKDILTVKNASDREIVAVIERTNWNDEATTAAEVTAMQEFRDLFSSEVLAPGQQVGIENVTILFSDLEGSTSLYEEVGDANAYGKVRRHFDYLTEWISKNNGSIVKTIGDAVMAVFYRPEDGIKAAVSIQQHINEFNKSNGDSIVLKIGIHSGPAIVVNSNDRLDYFGRTVNIAARIQNKSIGADIVVHRSYLENETIRLLLEQKKIVQHSFTALLKGIEDEMELVRIVNKK